MPTYPKNIPPVCSSSLSGFSIEIL